MANPQPALAKPVPLVCQRQPKVAIQLNKSLRKFKNPYQFYSASSERTQGYQIHFTQWCLQSKKNSLSVIYNPTLISTNLRLLERLPKLCSHREARSSRKCFTMEMHLLSCNYDQICQSLSKYFLCFWGREIEKS